MISDEMLQFQSTNDEFSESGERNSLKLLSLSIQMKIKLTSDNYQPFHRKYHSVK